MKKVTWILTVLTFALQTASAFAGQVASRNLPKDAHGFRIAQIELGGIQVGQKQINNSPTEGPAYEAVWAPAVTVSVTYQSVDKTDAPKYGSDMPGVYPSDMSPRVSFTFPITAAQEQAIRHHHVSVMNSLSLTTAAGTAKVLNSRQYHCQYDFENNKLDPNCHEDMSLVNEDVTVLTLELNL